MKKLAAVLFIISSADVFALEKYLMRVPDELNPQVGAIGVKMYDSEPPAISIPLRDGKFLVVRNETHRLESKYGSSGFGVPTKVVDLDVITRYTEAARHFPSITLQVGDSTLFAYRQENHYAGPLVFMGAEYVVGVYLPEGRKLDEEVRGLLKKVTFVPIAGLGVDTALKMYGPGSLVPAAARLKTVKKMVEERGECCELIELLSTLTSDAETKEWCRGRLKLLNPGKYAADDRQEIKEYNCDDVAQQKAVMELLSASRKADKAFVQVPAGDDDGVAAAVALKTKTVTLPGGAKMEFVWCEKGIFTMGQNDGEWEPSKKEEPRRKITLTKGFWLAKYETTQGQWKSVMGSNPAHFTGDDNLPVESVSWKMCKDFIRKAETDAGVKLRLPSEAEWEYACRAGTRTAYYWGYQANTKKANYNGEDKFHPERSLPTVGKTVKVGSYAPNAWGFHDMLGNVAEWCEDDWLDEPPTGNAQDPLHVKDGGTLKARRGGNWDSLGFACRAADRDWFGQGRKSNVVGVRFVLEETAGKTDASAPVATAQKPAAAEAKPASVQPAPAAAETKPASVQPAPATAETKPASVQPSPAAAEPKPAETVPAKPAEAAAQPKVAVKPGPGEMEYKGRKWRYEINRSGTTVWLKKNPLDDYSGVLEFPPMLGGLPLKTIDWQLFKDRKEIKGVVLPEGIEKIEENAFENCEGISQLVLPDSLETIEKYAFSGCAGICKLDLPKRLKTLGGDAFRGCRNLEGDFDLRNLEVLVRDTFNGCAKLHSVVLSEKIGEIDTATFESCSNLVNVTIPKSVGFIGSSAFRSCVSFKGVLDIPEGVTNIDWYAFAYCTGLTGVNLPKGLVKLGDAAFNGCTSLERLVLPEGLKQVSEHLAYKCASLKEVSIPSGVKRIRACAFTGCKALKSVTLPQGLERLENWSFQESGIESIDVPGGVKEIGPCAFVSCVSLKRVVLHEGLKTIRKGAFRACAALEEITIPASVESIEVEAFQDCTNLKKVVFLGKKPKIAMGTFKGCKHPDVLKLEPLPPKLPKGYGKVKMKTKTVTLPGGATMEMIYCPPGTYMMGTPEGMKKATVNDTEGPIKVTLTKGFWLGKYEVTQKQWQSVMGEQPEGVKYKGDDFPANCISWVRADEFCKKVGGKARLPTEGEWEYACRAGAPTAFPWGNTANGTQLACDGTRPFSYEEEEDKIPKGPKQSGLVKVGSYPSNAWGFHDMNGNVDEWCQDWFMMYWLKTKELTDPKGEDEKLQSHNKVLRGGCWDYGAWACTNSSRFDEHKDNRAGRGFRMAMDE